MYEFYIRLLQMIGHRTLAFNWLNWFFIWFCLKSWSRCLFSAFGVMRTVSGNCTDGLAPSKSSVSRLTVSVWSWSEKHCLTTYFRMRQTLSTNFPRLHFPYSSSWWIWTSRSKWRNSSDLSCDNALDLATSSSPEKFGILPLWQMGFSTLPPF